MFSGGDGRTQLVAGSGLSGEGSFDPLLFTVWDGAFLRHNFTVSTIDTL